MYNRVENLPGVLRVSERPVTPSRPRFALKQPVQLEAILVPPPRARSFRITFLTGIQEQPENWSAELERFVETIRRWAERVRSTDEIPRWFLIVQVKDDLLLFNDNPAFVDQAIVN